MAFKPGYRPLSRNMRENIHGKDQTAGDYNPENSSTNASGKKEFIPAFPMKNGHIQTIATGASFRRSLVRRRAAGMLAAGSRRIIPCNDDVRLLGHYSAHNPPSSNIVILIHGWGGSAESSYVVSAAGFLWDKGFDIFRLNLRDHGGTEHLNRGLFHSCRIKEVVSAIKEIQLLFRRKRTFVLGFSLGGNFALRIALRAPGAGIAIDRVAAVSPVLDPAHTMDAIENGWRLYHRYYLKKWRESLAAKKKSFPDIQGLENLDRFFSLSEMTAYFVKHFTDYPDMQDYFEGYTLTGDRLSGLSVPTLVITAKDDPVIPVEDFSSISKNDMLHLEIYGHGGHCGFFTGPMLKSHAEKRVFEFFGIKETK